MLRNKHVQNPNQARVPPDKLQVPIILGSDLIYENRMAEPLAALIRRVLAPDGYCLMAAQDRPATPALLEALTALGMHYTSQPVRAGVPGGERYKGNLFRITHTK